MRRKTFIFFCVVLSFGTLNAQQSESAPDPDYLYFKERVQPIFLEKRIGHARCVTCHSHRVPVLEPLSPGAVTWDNDQSRKNFEMWKNFVVPGKPLESRALLHPLAEEAGGDSFHAGGKHWNSTGDPEWQVFASWVRGQRLGATALPAGSGLVRVFQTNAAGDSVSVIDPATDEIVGQIEGIEAAHGIVVSPDGKRIYISNEGLNTLDVVDSKTLKIFKQVPLSGNPNNLDAAKDGSKVYVGIREAPGAVDVIDAVSLTNVKTIAVDGPIHNVYLVPDGTHVFAGSIESKSITVIDMARDEVSWTMKMDAGVRPMAFLKSGDGSTSYVIVELSDFHGFAVIDFGTRDVLARVEIPDQPGREKHMDTLQGSPSHGLAVSPDQQVLWVASKYYGAVAAFDISGRCRPGAGCGWKMLKIVDVGRHPDWLALTPDGKKLYVALAGEDATAVVDTESMEVVDRIAVGAVPKRNVAAELTTR